MSRIVTEYRVFISTPGGLGEVRLAFRAELRDYNELDALRRGLLFTPVGWEDTLGGARRPQSLINNDLKTCDAFVVVLRDRWGSKPDVTGPYSSGCEEEFQLASKYLKDPEHPMSDLLVFFRAADPRHLADPGPQLRRVLAFRKALETGKLHLFMVFDDLEAYRRRLRKHLAAWVYAHEQGQPLAARAPEPIEAASQEELLVDGTSGHPELEDAERLADEGRLTEAEAIFARATLTQNDPEPFDRYGRFLSRVGRLAQAEVMYEHVLRLAESAGERWEAAADGHLDVRFLSSVALC